MSRNNDDRLGIGDRNTGAEAPAIPSQPTQSQNSLLNFVSPTEFVELPSQGRYYSAGHPLHGKNVIEIKYMTAKEEDILTSQTLLKQGKALDRLLEQIVVDKSINVDTLLVGDKNAMLVAIRKSGYGANYATQVACPACDETQTYHFNLNDIKINLGGISGIENMVEQTESGTFLIKELPLTGWSVEVKPLDGKDERNIATATESRRKRKLSEDTLTTQMMAYVVSISGITDKLQIGEAITKMPARDAREVRAIYQQIMPNVDMTQTFVCEACEFSGDMEVPFTTDFFWPKQ